MHGFKNIKRLFFIFVKQSFFVIIFFFFNSFFAQSFAKVDAQVLTYSSNINTTEKLVSKINHDFSSELHKVRALYMFMTKHISYDLNEYQFGSEVYSFSYSNPKELKDKLRQHELKIISKTLTSKKAICEGYALTFKEICSLLNIQCKIIEGYSRTAGSKIGNFPKEAKHAWNAVFINSKWQLIDTTWGAGHVEGSNRWIKSFDEHYFLTQPKEFVTTHFPEEQKWQLLKSPLTQNNFADQPIYTSLFFQKKLQLISPKSGIINSNNEFIVIKIKNAEPTLDLGYAYENDQYLTSLKGVSENNITTIQIPIERKRNQVLNILSGTEVILQFLIQ